MKLLGLGIDRHWRTLPIKGRPTKMPSVPRGHKIVFRAQYHGTARRRYEETCHSLRRMQELYDQHAGKATISWYHTGVFVVPLPLAA